MTHNTGHYLKIYTTLVHNMCTVKKVAHVKESLASVDTGLVVGRCIDFNAIFSRRRY